MTTPTNTTQIDTTYLQGLQKQLQGILTDVDNQLAGIGPSSDPNGTGWLAPVDQNLTVQAGGTSFNAGAALNAALKKMGGSVNDQLTWLKKVLGDMVGEITTTINSFSGTESINNDAVTTLMGDFQKTIGDLNSPPGSSPGGSGSGTPTPSTPAPGTPAPGTPAPSSS